MKYVLVTCGVISGIGKGIISSSFGTILAHCGINITSIKLDHHVISLLGRGNITYIRSDLFKFDVSHGKVLSGDRLSLKRVSVLEYDSEVDLDMGNYERFVGVTLHCNNNIQPGKYTCML